MEIKENLAWQEASGLRKYVLTENFSDALAEEKARQFKQKYGVSWIHFLDKHPGQKTKKLENLWGVN